MIITLLEWIENIIPENSRANFYRNVSTLRVEIGTKEIESPKRKKVILKLRGNTT